jgi:hypothetical protein
MRCDAQRRVVERCDVPRRVALPTAMSISPTRLIDYAKTLRGREATTSRQQLLPYRLYIRERWHEVAIITVAANDHAASRKPSLRQRQPTRRAYASQKRRSKFARRRSMIGRPPTKSTRDSRGCWRAAVGNDASRRVDDNCSHVLNLDKWMSNPASSYGLTQCMRA